MRVLAAQVDPVELAPEDNLARAVAILGRAANAGADLVVLPETWTTGYDLPAARRLVDRSEAVLNLLADAARSAGVAVVGSMVLPTPTGAANAGVMIDAHGDVALRYAKSHLIDLYGEKSIFEPGRATPTVEIAGTRLGVARGPLGAPAPRQSGREPSVGGRREPSRIGPIDDLCRPIAGHRPDRRRGRGGGE